MLAVALGQNLQKISKEKIGLINYRFALARPG
jgi:hypothetical protein